MQEFVVLGQVPGTNTQLGFTEWLLVSAIILTLLLLVLARHQIAATWNAHILKARAKRIESLAL